MNNKTTVTRCAVGTSHFVSIAAARRYYAPYGEDAAGVDRKIAAGEISVGEPEIKAGERLTVNNEGRYFIAPVNPTSAAMQDTNDLPVVITAAGDYRTRDGRRVTIHEVQDQASPYTFKAKGAIWRMFRGAERPRGFQVWHVSGRLDMVHQKAGDIVAPWA